MFTPAAGVKGRGPRWCRGSSEVDMLVQAREGGARNRDVAQRDLWSRWPRDPAPRARIRVGKVLPEGKGANGRMK